MLLLLVPLCSFLFFRFIFGVVNINNVWRPSDEALLISAIFSSGLCLVTIVYDGLTMAFLAIVRRVSEFIGDLFRGISLKNAAAWYKENLRNDGATFWIMLAPMILNALYLVFAIKHYYAPHPAHAAWVATLLGL